MHIAALTLTALSSAHVVAHVAADCTSIPGFFIGSKGGVNFTGELYHATWSSPGVSTVSSIGSPAGWSKSTLTFSADNNTVRAVFDNLHVGTGNVTAGCATILWDDKSRWASTPAPPQIRVHLAPHSHDDVCAFSHAAVTACLPLQQCATPYPQPVSHPTPNRLAGMKRIWTTTWAATPLA